MPLVHRHVDTYATANMFIFLSILLKFKICKFNETFWKKEIIKVSIQFNSKIINYCIDPFDFEISKCVPFISFQFFFTDKRNKMKISKYLNFLQRNNI